MKQIYALEMLEELESPPTRGARIETTESKAAFLACVIAPHAGGAD